MTPINYPSLKTSSVQKLKEILRAMIEKGEDPPKGCEAPEVQNECNHMIREYFTEKKVSRIDARQ